MRALILGFGVLLLGTGCDQIQGLFGSSADPNMSGKVTSVRGSTGASMYADVTITFSNMAKKDLGVRKYVVRWPEGKYRGQANVRVPHGGQTSITAKVLPKDGDILILLDRQTQPTVQIIETFE